MASTKQISDVPSSGVSKEEGLSQFVAQKSEASERTFTCFQKLPPELRLKIWVIALSVPRVIVLEHSKLFRELLEGGSDKEESDDEDNDADEDSGGDSGDGHGLAGDGPEGASVSPEGDATSTYLLSVDAATANGGGINNNANNNGSDREPAEDNQLFNYLPNAVACRTRPPALLHVCRESRAEAAKAYMTCDEIALLKPIQYQNKVDVLLMQDPYVLYAFPYQYLQISGRKLPVAVPITRIAIVNVDFQTIGGDSEFRSEEWSPILIGKKIVEMRSLKDLERVTFITSALSTDVPLIEICVPTLKKIFYRNAEDSRDPEKNSAV